MQKPNQRLHCDDTKHAYLCDGGRRQGYSVDRREYLRDSLAEVLLDDRPHRAFEKAYCRHKSKEGGRDGEKKRRATTSTLKTSLAQ